MSDRSPIPFLHIYSCKSNLHNLFILARAVVQFGTVVQGLFLDILKKKLKLRKTQNSSQILKKLGANFQKTKNLPTPLEFSCQNGDQSQKKMVFRTLQM